MRPWTDIYAPQTISQVVGHDTELPHLAEMIKKKRPVLLYGPAGVGKTAVVHALAHELGYDVVEVNASDVRNADHVQQVVGGALQQASLFARGRIILVDELDGISGNEDRGGITALQLLLDQGGHAVVLVANDPWDTRFSTLRKKCGLIEFKKVRPESIAKALFAICSREGIHASLENLKELGRRSGGDVRAAINDLQSLTAGKNILAKEDLGLLDERDQEKNIFEAMRMVFKGTDAGPALNAFDSVDLEPNEVLLWLEENLPLEYRGTDLARGFDALSRSDVFQGRIRKRQYWRFLVYVRTYLIAGVMTAKEKPSYGYTPYRRYQRLLTMWMANQRNFKRKEIAQIIKKEAHCSTRRAVQEYIPYLQIMAKHKKTPSFLTEEQTEWLKK